MSATLDDVLAAVKALDTRLSSLDAMINGKVNAVADSAKKSVELAQHANNELQRLRLIIVKGGR